MFCYFLNKRKCFETALDAYREINRRKKYVGNKVYECDYCGYFHIGMEPKFTLER